MEPSINPDLTHNVDLTLPLMRDIGWAPDADLDGVTDGADQCLHSDLRTTVVVGSCDSGVGNTLFANGCTIADQVAGCGVGAGNHGAFVSCVAHLTNALLGAGVISGSQKDAIQGCAGGALIPYAPSLIRRKSKGPAHAGPFSSAQKRRSYVSVL
jgi:hypothetical protein